MSNCKYCNAEISWLTVDGKNIPMNPDNTQHKCQTKGQPSTSKEAASIETKIANLKAFIECVQNVPGDAWAACAGVWNGTK